MPQALPPTPTRAKAPDESSTPPSSSRSPSPPSPSKSPSPQRSSRFRSVLVLAVLGAFIVGRTANQQPWSQKGFLAGFRDISFQGSTATGTNTLSNKKPHLLEDSQFFLNDPTLRLSPYVDRLWLHDGHHLPELPPGDKPNTKLILTDFGWNHPDPEKGKQFVRSLRTRELMQAVVDHPLFDPTFQWSEMEAGKPVFDPNLQYFVFFDVETAFESNYPKYGGGFDHNFDWAGERVFSGPGQNQCFYITHCDAIKRVLDSPLFQKVPTARVFYFDSRGDGAVPEFRKNEKSEQLSIVSVSCGPDQHLPSSDMGQPPPPIKPVRLPHGERTAILQASCDAITADEINHQRPYFLTCIGSVRNDVRGDLLKLHDPSSGIVLMLPPAFTEQYTQQKNITYKQIMQHSLFSAAPRGDNKFSYRFSEVLSAGAIPVVHADNWVLPFRSELIDWPKECAIVIPEANVSNTIEILRAISPKEQCERRRRCYQVYTKYIANPEGTIAGVLESATLAIAANGKSHSS